MADELTGYSKAARCAAEIHVDSRIHLIAEPARGGRVNLIDWGHYRARICWDSGLVSGVDLGDIVVAPEAPMPALERRPSISSLGNPVPAE